MRRGQGTISELDSQEVDGRYGTHTVKIVREDQPDLLCLDDSGMKSFPPKGAEALLEIIVRRHRNRLTLMRSNRPIEE